jgi:hypothetical protein
VVEAGLLTLDSCFERPLPMRAVGVRLLAPRLDPEMAVLDLLPLPPLELLPPLPPLLPPISLLLLLLLLLPRLFSLDPGRSSGSKSLPRLRKLEDRLLPWVDVLLPDEPAVDFLLEPAVPGPLSARSKLTSDCALLIDGVVWGVSSSAGPVS